MEQDYVQVWQEDYEKMIDQLLWLDALEAAGVDNWEGYDEAQLIYKEWQEENNG